MLVRQTGITAYSVKKQGYPVMVLLQFPKKCSHFVCSIFSTAATRSARFLCRRRRSFRSPVAVPGIRFASLAACRPQPLARLPFSATGGGRLAPHFDTSPLPCGNYINNRSENQVGVNDCVPQITTSAQKKTPIFVRFYPSLMRSSSVKIPQHRILFHKT